MVDLPGQHAQIRGRAVFAGFPGIDMELVDNEVPAARLKVLPGNIYHAVFAQRWLLGICDLPVWRHQSAAGPPSSMRFIWSTRGSMNTREQASPWQT